MVHNQRLKMQSTLSKKILSKDIDPPLVNRFIGSPAVSLIVFPNISSIIKEQRPSLMLLPDGPAIDDALLDGLYDEHTVSRVAIDLLKRNAIKRSDYVWFHLDTGVTCTVSHCSGESHCPTPTTIKCGTAADGPSHVVESLGYLICDFETSQSTMVPFEIPDHATIPSSKRRSMSLHALKYVVFDVIHSLLEKGNFLTIRRAGSYQRFQSIPLITHGRSDYVRVKRFKTSSDTLTDTRDLATPLSRLGMTHQSIACINLAKTLTGSSLYALEHYRYGCPGEKAQFQMTDKHSPTDFHCPLCMQEKTKSLPSQKSTFTTLLPIGARIQIHFGFYRIDSIRGFRSFLMCIESRTSYRWAYLRRNKKPPIKLIVWFVKYLRRYFGFSVCVIRTDGGGELWGRELLRNTLSEMEPPVLMEPTGAETSSANGKAERSIGLAGVTTQLLLGMANLKVVFWCFALLHGVILLNVRPNSESGFSRRFPILRL
jgi:hypothetical protein